MAIFYWVQTLPKPAATYNYPGTNNLLSTVTQGATTVRSFTYDGAGNITADARGSTTYNYRYNKRGRLDQLTIGSTVTANYTYDGLERMAIRVTQNMTPAGTTHYLYDLSGHLLVEADNTGATLREYAWLDDLPLAVVSDVNTVSPNLYYVHADQVNRPLRMTDSSKAVVWDAVYKPFGEVVSITGSASNNLRFPGQYFLIEDGLHYNWYRHYDPSAGRYVQADPLRDATSMLPIDFNVAAFVTWTPRFSAQKSVAVSQLSNILTASQFFVPIEFINGPSLYAYAKSSAQMLSDPTGLFQSEVVVMDDIKAWTDKKLSEQWGKKAAARVFHICDSGMDVEIDPFAPGAATAKPIRYLDCVPGSPQRAATKYDVMQALSYVATHRNNAEERGRVKCWGQNNKGQLGDGTRTDRLTPVFVVGL